MSMTLYIPKGLAVSTMATHIFLTTIPTKVKMRKMADELERIDGQIAGIYAEKTGKKPEALLKMME